MSDFDDAIKRADERRAALLSVPTVGEVTQGRPCGCKVGLLSDVDPTVPENVRQHVGSLPNPWIVIPCAQHADSKDQPTNTALDPSFDPNAALETIRAAVIMWNKNPGEQNVSLLADVSSDMIGAVRELDDWITKGGVLPACWDYADRVTASDVAQAALQDADFALDDLADEVATRKERIERLLDRVRRGIK